MDERARTRLSKFLSKHLRHAPEAIGLSLLPGGWVEVDALLAACAARGLAVTRAELEEVVQSSDKQRFAFDETATRIRANQGHSVDVDLALAPQVPPDVLYHGTATRFLPAILAEGLRRMERHHVHLSAEHATAVTVGTRHGRPVVLAVAAGAMHAAGATFFRAANGVWLVDHVPPAQLHVLPDAAPPGPSGPSSQSVPSLPDVAPLPDQDRPNLPEKRPNPPESA